MADSRPDDGVAVPWLAGVVLAGIGAGLAVVALTFPWISVGPLRGRRRSR